MIDPANFTVPVLDTCLVLGFLLQWLNTSPFNAFTASSLSHSDTISSVFVSADRIKKFHDEDIPT